MKLFGKNGILVFTFHKAKDILLLNMLWLIFSLPIITIGASTVAAYTVAFKIIRGAKVSVAEHFIKAWKENLKKGTQAFCFLLLFGGVIIFGAYYYIDRKVSFSSLAMGSLLLGTVLFSIMYLYTFPLIARYENTVKQTIKNSLFISLRYCYYTLQMLLISAVFIVFCILNPYTSVMFAFFGPGLMIFLLAFLFHRVFLNLEEQLNQKKRNNERKDMSVSEHTEQEILDRPEIRKD